MKNLKIHDKINKMQLKLIKYQNKKRKIIF